MISPFISPVTKKKIQFVKLRSKHLKEDIIDKPHKWDLTLQEFETFKLDAAPILEDIPADNLETMYGGDYHFIYEHEHYWNHLLQSLKE